MFTADNDHIFTTQPVIPENTTLPTTGPTTHHEASTSPPTTTTPQTTPEATLPPMITSVTTCVPYPILQNGYVKALVPDSSIEYACFLGYFLEGEAVLMCQNDGSWSPPSPGTCLKG